MKQKINLSNMTEKKVFPLGQAFCGDNGVGIKLEATNTDLRFNGAPFFGVTGEVHFSRVAEDQFEDAIIKMKMGGVNIASTYVFWIVHEEEEGVFRFDGSRNIRKFIELCRKHGMYVILRIGPFDHGEMRNGGLPDWLYGKPFECRNDSEGYFACVRRLYEKIHEQIDGLYFDQNGPIIGIQVENEYMHSSAPWEISTGVSTEWVPGGNGGTAHMEKLQAIAKEVGIRAPFFTCTAWGGAMTPENMLPLWGGYAYQPWLFYNEVDKPHPVTPEYLYRDNHNNAVPKTYNFEPRYAPESRPYACCEMMGGMFCSYNYRFILPFESVDALANIKLGSGCTLLGYYMYRGGTTPQGKRTPFLNENQTPKLSYDFQAPIGEFGQLRPSYHRLRAIHTFCHTFRQLLCESRTVTPEGTEELDPTDTERLRFCVRGKDGSGFLFLNNFQDHLSMTDKKDEKIVLELPDGDLMIDDISIAANENAILPFRLDLGGIMLNYSTAQPLTYIDTENERCWFFFTPSGMKSRYHLRAADVDNVSGCAADYNSDELICRPAVGQTTAFTLHTAKRDITVVTLTREDSLQFYSLPVNGVQTAFLCSGGLLQDGSRLRAETDSGEITVMAYPPLKLSERKNEQITSLTPAEKSIFRGYTYTLNPAISTPETLTPNKISLGRYTIDLPHDRLSGRKTVLLRLSYVGDIGNVFIDGRIINDNFCNGAPWDIRVDNLCEELQKNPLTVYIVPIRRGAKVNVDSPMAARMEQTDSMTAQLDSAQLRFVNEIDLLP